MTALLQLGFACDPAALHYISQINRRVDSVNDSVEGVAAIERFAEDLVADDRAARTAVSARARHDKAARIRRAA